VNKMEWVKCLLCGYLSEQTVRISDDGVRNDIICPVCKSVMRGNANIKRNGYLIVDMSAEEAKNHVEND